MTYHQILSNFIKVLHMNAIAINAAENINPLQAAATDLPAATDGLALPTGAGPVDTEGNALPVVDPAAAVETPAPAPVVEKVVLPQDEQLALDIENIDAQIAVLQKRREGKAQLLANLDKLAGIKEGTILVVQQGRAETTRQVEGVVVAIADGKFKLSVGTGFDATYVVVGSAQIIEVK